jgi:Predicted ATPases of PP-loop superfamily
MSGVAVSWSGGKDCALACYWAKNNGLQVKYLASIITEDTGKLWPHMISPGILRLQAQAMGIPFLEWTSTADGYDESYCQMLQWLKTQGIHGAIFGDVRIGNSGAANHLHWIKSVCEPTGMDYYLPLWPYDREMLLTELIDLGFEVRIIAVDSKYLGEDWLGRKLDRHMLDELKVRHQLSPDGKVGYYHTFVTDGPIFKSKLVIEKWDRVLDQDIQIMDSAVWYMDIQRCKLESKSPAEALPCIS